MAVAVEGVEPAAAEEAAAEEEEDEEALVAGLLDEEEAPAAPPSALAAGDVVTGHSCISPDAHSSASVASRLWTAPLVPTAAAPAVATAESD